jgi:hypothetical protein
MSGNGISGSLQFQRGRAFSSHQHYFESFIVERRGYWLAPSLGVISRAIIFGKTASYFEGGSESERVKNRKNLE